MTAAPPVCEMCAEPIIDDEPHEMPDGQDIYLFHPDCCPECEDE